MASEWWVRCVLVTMLGVASTVLGAGCNQRELSISISNREYVPPPAPKMVQAKPEPPPPPRAEPPMEVVREAPIAPPVPPQAPVSQARVLGDVYFGFDRSDIRPEGRSVLQGAMGLLKAEPERTLVIEGHCDERGTHEYNLVLGERRAQAVRDSLLQQGINASRLMTTSYGKEQPVCHEHAPSCWKQNRRAHLVLE